MKTNEIARLRAELAEARSRVIEEAKVIYQRQHPGQCKMFSLGDACTCVLCELDALRAVGEEV